MNTANIAAPTPSASALQDIRRNLRGMEENLHQAKELMAAIYLMGAGLRSMDGDNAAAIETVARIGEGTLDALIESFRNTWASLNDVSEPRAAGAPVQEGGAS